MSRKTRRVLVSGAFGSSAIAAIVLLMTFYAVVHGAVDRSNSLRNQIYATAPGRG